MKEDGTAYRHRPIDETEYDKGYQQGKIDAINEIIEHCEMRQRNNNPFQNNCYKCQYYKSTRGCIFYNRPIDWDIPRSKLIDLTKI